MAHNIIVLHYGRIDTSRQTAICLFMDDATLTSFRHPPPPDDQNSGVHVRMTDIEQIGRAENINTYLRLH